MIEGATVKSSLIADGCRIGKGAVIENSVVGLRCVIGENAVIRDSVLREPTLWRRKKNWLRRPKRDCPPVGIGDGSEILGAILDKNCRIGKMFALLMLLGRFE